MWYLWIVSRVKPQIYRVTSTAKSPDLGIDFHVVEKCLLYSLQISVEILGDTKGAMAQQNKDGHKKDDQKKQLYLMAGSTNEYTTE